MLFDDSIAAINKAMDEFYNQYEPPEMIDLEALLSQQNKCLKDIADHTAELERIAISATEQAALAKAQALDAKHDAAFSKIISIISIITGIGSLIISIAALALR